MSYEINLIEGERGKIHVTSDDARTENALMFGVGRKVLNIDDSFEATLKDSNTVRIASGVFYDNGMFIRIDRDKYVEVNVENGLPGVFRNDLICIRYERNIQTQLESASIVVKKGVASETEAVDPEYTEGDVLDLEVHLDEFPLYRVSLDGVTPTLEPMFLVEDEISNIAIYESLIKHMQADNPHEVTAEQVGLGNVPNVATNNQTPTYTIATSNAALKSGEKLSVAFGKIAKAVNSLISHLANVNNPHSVTKKQVGLDKVENTADADKSVKYAATAGTAESAETAEKATQDANGNIIAETYATKEEVEKIADPDKSIVISNTITGTNPTATDSTDAPIISQIIKGYTVQDGTPTPDSPVEIESLGDLQEDGSYKVAVKTCGKNLFGGLTLAQAIVDSGSTEVMLDESAKTVTFKQNTNYQDKEKRILFSNFKENTQYTLVLNGIHSDLGIQIGIYTTNLYIRYTDGSSTDLRATNENEFTIVVTSDTGKTVESFSYGYSQMDSTTLYYEQCGIFEGVITADEFEPYTETTAELSLSEPLYEGDYIKYRANGSGVLHRSMCGAVFDGSDDEVWNKSDAQTGDFYMLFTDFDTACRPKIKDNITKELFCSHLKYATYGSDFAIGNITVSNAAIHLWISDGSQISDIAEWKAWLAENPITVVYELATPTEIELTAEELEQFKNLRTFEPVTNIICDGETETTYYKATDNGEVVSALHEKVDSANESIESLNESLKETDTVVGGAVGANGDTNVSYTDIQDIDPDGNVYFSQENGGSLVNGLKNATSQIRGMFASLKNVFSLKTHNHDDTYVKKEEFTGFKYLKTVDLANYAELGPEYRAKVGQLGFDRYMFNLRATQTYDYSEHDVDIMNIIKPANEPVMKHIPPVMGLNSSYTSIVSFFSGVVYISDGDVEFLLSIDAGGTNPKVPSDYRVDIYGAMD
ncbi:MAG: hypothetical protein IJN92_09595 [Lachnospiraceae bacterium]|nr:hypothetical protein [Lachnospiraceae bacterium]